MSSKQHQDKLPNAPLQEVVFELLWEVDKDEHGFPHDAGFDFAQGIFADSLKKDFPAHKKTPFESAPFRAYPVHQFWKKENEWPVIQLGPGLLVVNDIEANYTWNKYRTLVKKTVGLLCKAYESKMDFMKVRLKYIDAFEAGDGNLLQFINENFRLKLQNDFTTDSNPAFVNINQTFSLGSLGHLEVLMATGWSPNNIPAVIWQSTVNYEGRMNSSQLSAWLEKAHNEASNHFKNIVNKDFYAKFTQEK